jgi:hypothetical protein
MHHNVERKYTSSAAEVRASHQLDILGERDSVGQGSVFAAAVHSSRRQAANDSNYELL